jgi:DNA polymerase
MRHLHIDLETYSQVDLKAAGAFRYVEDESFKILLTSAAIDNEPVKLYEYEDWRVLIPQLLDPTITKVAHNASFEMTCLSKYIPILPEQWECTAIMCRQAGLPASLEQAAEVAGLTDQKDKRGKALIRLFSMPNKQGVRTLPEDRPADWEDYKSYNKQDVEVERELYAKLKRFGMNEKELFVLDYNMNKRGVQIDTDLAAKAVRFADVFSAEARAELVRLTGMDRPTDPAIRNKYNIPSLGKRELAEVRRNFPELAEVLDVRSRLSLTSLKKYEAMLACVGTDGRARGLTQYYGAGRTGRWSGRLIQLQNLPRPELKDAQIETARSLLRFGDDRLFSLLYGDDSLNCLSNLVRSAIVPAPGHSFVVADFSAIEARVLAWISGEQWRLDVFNGDGRIYETSAERMFNLPAGSVGKDNPMRQRGKVAELALGYGGGAGALVAMGALNYGVPENELPELVKLWRAASPKVTAFWKTMDTLMRICVEDRALNYRHPHVYVTKEKGPMQIVLPNGRRLTYQGAHWEQTRMGGEIFFEGINQVTNQWGRQDLYGAKATENVVQAIARDCLAEVITWAEQEGLRPVFHVHDELVCEVPTERQDGALSRLLDRMKVSPEWAPGLPLKGDGFVCEYYRK